MSVDDGWLRGVRRALSPNCDLRPDGTEPTLIVVHGISLPPNEFGGPWIDDLFTGNLDGAAHPYFGAIAPGRVSAHILISRDGLVTQYVCFDLRAWHAGRSSYRGRERCNDFSMGIELEGADHIAYEAAQYQTLSDLIRSLRIAYPSIAEDGLVGHADIAPGRKTDPGPAFDWDQLRELLRAAS